MKHSFKRSEHAATSRRNILKAIGAGVGTLTIPGLLRGASKMMCDSAHAGGGHTLSELA